MPTAGSQIDHKELSFGVEFTLDHVISSVTVADGSTFGLAKVHGGDAYRSLMRRYLEICHGVHLTRVVPFEKLRGDLNPNYETCLSGLSGLLAAPEPVSPPWQVVRRRERDLQTPTIRHSEHSYWHYLKRVDIKRSLWAAAILESREIAGDADADAEVLSQAVEALRHAMRKELVHLDLTSIVDPWAFASMVVPDFLFTTTKPKPH